jgi:hypothetical protein
VAQEPQEPHCVDTGDLAMISWIAGAGMGLVLAGLGVFLVLAGIGFLLLGRRKRTKFEA